MNILVNNKVYVCPACKGTGDILTGLKHLFNKVEGLKFPIYLPPTKVYSTCGNCNGDGCVDDLYPEHQMD